MKQQVINSIYLYCGNDENKIKQLMSIQGSSVVEGLKKVCCASSINECAHILATTPAQLLVDKAQNTL